MRAGVGLLDRLGTVAIIGVGLIGGSVGLALRTRKLAEWVVGIGRDAGRLAEARRLGAIDEATTDFQRGCAGAEVVVIGTPVTRVAADVALAARHAARGALVTDAGSTKRQIVEQIEQDETSRAVFVGAHPIAGSERKGAAFARADLFEGRVCVVTPTERTPADRLARARAFWSSLGCRILVRSPESHDAALAWTSHLPHAVASALAASVPPELLALAAGAYRDGTRVAGSDAALWTGIFLANRGPMIEALDDFGRRLGAFRAALVDGDEAALSSLWEQGRANRNRYAEHDPPESSEYPESCST
jgi:prephenate dehydrogenase